MSIWSNYETIKIYSVQEFQDMIVNGVEWLNGATFDCNRMRTLIRKGPQCVSCDVVGNMYALQKARKDFSTNWYHWNLWQANESRTHFILLTRDHIHPVSKGGSNDLDNSQCMCTSCNLRKADKVIK